MDKQDKFYIIFLIVFLGTLIGIPAYENMQFNNILTKFESVTKQSTDFLTIFYAVTQSIIHNQGVLIHNEQIIIHNQGQFAKYGMPDNDNTANFTTPDIRNDMRTDFQNITIHTPDTD